MDEIRRIRLLVAPALFVASILWGAWLDRTNSTFWSQTFGDPDWPRVIGLIAGGGFVVFVAGYIIGTITYVLLRLLFPFIKGTRHHFHEAAVSKESLKIIGKKIGALGHLTPQQELLAVVAFDHGVLKKDWEGIHQWIVRRWTAFNMAMNSICG